MARIYWRRHGSGPARAWGDFTSLGYGREPLVEPGSPKRLGTTSRVIATKVFAERLAELQQAKIDSARLGVQLADILSEYLGKFGSRLNRLLFPSEILLARGKEGLIRDSRKMLDTLGSRVGFRPGEVRWNKLRHGYATARLQTLDNGAPISTFTVARELGHTSVQLVERIYGHLGDVRHRSEIVEFRVEHHTDQWVSLLADLGASAG